MIWLELELVNSKFVYVENYYDGSQSLFFEAKIASLCHSHTVAYLSLDTSSDIMRSIDYGNSKFKDHF